MVTSAVLATLLSGAILNLDSTLVGVVLGVFMVVGAWEWTFLAGVRSLRSRLLVILTCIISTVLIYRFAADGTLRVIIWVTALWWMLAFGIVVAYQTTERAPAVARLRDCAIGCFVLAGCWVTLVKLHLASAHILFLLMLMVWGADVGAYIIGRPLGKHKLAKRVSPGKSWEGVGAGYIFGGLMAVAVCRVFSLELSAVVITVLVFVTVTFSIVGDLTESMLKRRVGKKNSGEVLPGHGGVLDRIDGLIAAAPLFWLVMRIAGTLPE